MATEKILIFDEAGNAKRMKVRIARFLDNEPVTASDKENIRTTLNVDDSLSGTFTTPLSVTSASDSSFTGGGKVGIGGSPGYELDVQAANARIAATSSAGVVNHLQADSTGAWVGPLSNHNLYLKTNNTNRATIDSSGKVGIANSSPGSYFSNANALVVGTGADAHQGVTIATNSLGGGHVYFADATGTSPGRISYYHTGNNMLFYVDENEQARLTAAGNLVMTGGGGIDFGSGSTGSGTVTGGLLSDYEEGTWTPSFSTSGAAFTNPPTMDVIVAEYVKVGRHVHCQAYIRTDNVDTTGASGTVVVDGLPFVSDASSGNSGTLNVGYSASWVNAPASGYTQPDGAYARLTRYSTSGASTITPSDLTAGASANQNELIFSISYISKT